MTQQQILDAISLLITYTNDPDIPSTSAIENGLMELRDLL
jgi:hypothetical protein